MILTHGPDDVCLGDWFVITETNVARFPTLTRAMDRIRDIQRIARQQYVPVRHYFVHWSHLTDEERNRIFSV